MLKIKNLVYIKNMENKKRGRPIKYNSEEERKQAKRIQDQLSYKRRKSQQNEILEILSNDGSSSSIYEPSETETPVYTNTEISQEEIKIEIYSDNFNLCLNIKK